MKTNSLYIALLLMFTPASLYAQDPFVYPQKGQSAQQIQRDEYECYGWAKQQTGFDPMKTPQASSPPPAQTSSPGVGRSVVRGAAIGGLGGSLGGEFGKGAAAGAAVGLVGGGIRRRNHASNQQAQNQAWAEQESARYQQQRDGYNRAFGACMEGRGYTVR